MYFYPLLNHLQVKEFEFVFVNDKVCKFLLTINLSRFLVMLASYVC